MYLLEEPKRQKVIAALAKAIHLAERGNFPDVSEKAQGRKLRV
jgi:hypothetical protein